MAAYITVGATTTHGGEVITGSPHTTHNGVQVSRKGNRVICRKCKKVTTILTGDPSFIVDGAPIAREGDVTSCGAKLIAIQQSFCESDFEVFGVEQPEPKFEQPAPLVFPKSDPAAVFASFTALEDQKPDLFAEPDRGDKDLDAWREDAVSDGLEKGLVADSSGGLLSDVGPSNQDISDYTGIPKDKIDAAANTLGGFNQMWSFGASDAIAGRPDPNSAGTKAGQVAGMAAGVYTGSAAGSAVKTMPKKGFKFSLPKFSATRVLEKPRKIWGRSAKDIAKDFKDAGYTVVEKGSKVAGNKSEIIQIQGHKQITQIQVSPSSKRHGGKYYKISTSDQGIVKVVDKKTYKSTPGEKATIIYK